MSKIVLSDAAPTGYNDPLTEDEVENLVSLRRDEGLTTDEIAERIGRSHSTVARYLARNGFASRTPRVKTPPLFSEQWRKIQQGKNSGMLSVEVADALGLRIDEVNKAYAAPTYDYYINHR